MNFLWVDVETTGLYSDKHDVVQLACIPIVNGVRQDFFNEFSQPKNWEAIEDGAIRVHGITRERMKTFQTQEQLVEKLVTYLRQFNTKFIIAGYNVGFDKRFIADMFAKCGQPEDFFSLFELHVHDTYARVKSIKTQIKTENHKLETLAKHYGIEIKAHDAYSDIAATIEVDKQVGKLMGEEERVTQVAATEVNLDDYNLPEPAQLHVHSMYGMVESVPEPKDWAKWCKEKGIPGFSVVDHGPAISMIDAVKLSDDDVTAVPGVGMFFMKDGELHPFNAWAVSSHGYINVMKLSSLGYETQIEVDGIIRPIVTAEDIEAHKVGVVFGTGDIYGAIGEHLKKGNRILAHESFKEYVHLFGEQLRAEFIPVSIKESYSSKTGFQPIRKNDLIPDGDLGKAYNNFMMDMVEEYKVSAIPSSSAHFIEKRDKLLQDVIAKNSYDSGKYYIESYHARLGKEMYKVLKEHLGDRLDLDQFRGWIDNTLDIVTQAHGIKPKHDYHMPVIDIPDEIKQQTDDYDKQTLLYTIQLCKQHGRWRDDPEYVARFKKEVKVIMQNGTLNFLPYFLLYEDICTHARSQGILQGIGRGSAGGCLLSYYLKIIHVDPIECDLPFERFLSLARINAGSFPDIDCDFGDRTDIIDYLDKKYGVGFAQICTFQRMKTKNAIKDAMWALYGKNRKDPNVEAVCKLIPDSPQGVNEYDFLYGFTNKEGEYTPGAVETTPELEAFFMQFSQVEEMVKRLVGLVRGWGRHASAYVVSTIDLSERVPTMKMYDKHLDRMINVTQCDAYKVEDAGLVKADILGVTTIQSISDCIEFVKERTGIDYLEEDNNGTALIYRLPEDQSVYRDFYNKRTDSSFQFNTSLIKGYIQEFAPTQREHLSAMTALCRPGALDAPFTNDEISLEDGVSAAQYYMDVRNGKRKLSYLHPDLATCTSNGVFVYQEEVMKFLVDYGGYTLEESDRIRGAIAKKKQEVMMEAFDKIRINCSARGWTPTQIKTVCDMVQAFARYSFNRSHSRCYGDTGYITMYLKHHHKLEWWAAELNNSMDKEEKVRGYMTLLGDIVGPPSVKNPSKGFQINENTITAPVSVLKRIGDSCADELVEKGPFVDLDDYIARVQHNKVNIGHFSSLIKGRAADCFMDKTIDYADARLALMNEYVTKRKCKPFKEEMYDVDPMAIFLMERETNKCFNKTLLKDSKLLDRVVAADPEFSITGRNGVPLLRHNTPILANLMVAKGLVEKEHEQLIGMVMLFEGSSIKKGVSKKSGKPYQMVKIELSDGYTTTECVWWDRKKALNFPINSIVFVRGQLKSGWKTPVSITIQELERLT